MSRVIFILIIVKNILGRELECDFKGRLVKIITSAEPPHVIIGEISHQHLIDNSYYGLKTVQRAVALTKIRSNSKQKYNFPTY